MTTSALGDDDAVAVIGPRSPGAAGLGLVVLPGAILEVDPAEPDLLSRLTVHDPDFAAELIDALLRTEDLEVDASALLLAASGFRAGVVPTADLRSLLRLGLVNWLDRYSPDRLSQFWLDLEIGCRTAWAADLVDEPDETIRARLLPHVDVVLGLAERDRTGADAVPSALSSLVQDAIEILAELDDVPRRSDLDHAAELGIALRRLGTQTLDWDTRALDAEFFKVDDRLLAGASHAGADPAQDRRRRGRGSADWLQTVRGLLDPAEGTVSWEIGASGDHIDVQVAAGYRATPGTVLGYRLLDGSGTLVGAGLLTLDPTAALFRGSGRVGEGLQELQVDVFDPLRMRPPRTGVSAVVAEAERAAARAVTLTRLATGARQVSRAAPSLDQLQRSSRLYRSAAQLSATDVATREWVGGLEARHAQTLQTLYDVADLMERSVVRNRAAAALDRLGHRPHAGSIDDELTAAEIALLNPGS